MKILISTGTSIDLFCKNPIKILTKSDNGAVAVFKNNTPVFYAVTPDFLRQLFEIKNNENHSSKNIINMRTKKFAMHSKWVPDKDFIHQAALWGIILKKNILSSELSAFISYWKSEGCFFHHVQWQQKLARSLQKSRNFNYKTQKIRDITCIPNPDTKIPDGFRGE